MAGCCFIRKGAGVLAGVLITFLLVLFLGLGPLSALGAEWSVYHSNYFLFYYQDEHLGPEIQEYASESEKFIQFALQRLGALTFTPTPVECYIVTSFAQGMKNPPKGSLYNFYAEGIFLFNFPESALFQQIIGPGSEMIGSSYFTVLRQCYRGQDPHTGALLYLKLQPLQLPSLEEILANPNDFRANDLFLSFIAWLEERFGPDKLLKLHSLLEDNQPSSLNEKLLEIYGQDLKAMSSAWMDFLKETLQNHPLTLDAELYQGLNQGLKEIAQSTNLARENQDFQENFFKLANLSSYYLARLDLQKSQFYYQKLQQLLEEKKTEKEREARSWVYSLVGIGVILILTFIALVGIYVYRRRKNTG